MNDLDIVTCRQLKYRGLKQSRIKGSRYYVLPEVVINIDDIGDLRTLDNLIVDWEQFVFIPTIEDLLSFLGEDWWETRREHNKADPHRQVTSYSTVKESADQFYRASGMNVLWSLANLALLVKDVSHETLKVIKEFDKNIFTIVGGIYPTTNDVSFDKNIDYIIKGEGEKGLLYLCFYNYYDDF